MLKIRMEKKIGTTQECYVLFWANPGRNTLQNSSCAATYFSSHKLPKEDEEDMWGIAEEARTNS